MVIQGMHGWIGPQGAMVAPIASTHPMHANTAPWGAKIYAP